MPAFRKGDVVTIEATIASTPFTMDDGKAKVKIEFPPFHDAYVDPADLTLVRPSFEIGDWVAWIIACEDYAGRVLSIANDHLWVDLGEGCFATVWAGKATRADPKPSPEVAEPPPCAEPACASEPPKIAGED
jgi:hypothetical protein